LFECLRVLELEPDFEIFDRQDIGVSVQTQQRERSTA